MDTRDSKSPSVVFSPSKYDEVQVWDENQTCWRPARVTAVPCADHPHHYWCQPDGDTVQVTATVFALAPRGVHREPLDATVARLVDKLGTAAAPQYAAAPAPHTYACRSCDAPVEVARVTCHDCSAAQRREALGLSLAEVEIAVAAIRSLVAVANGLPDTSDRVVLFDSARLHRVINYAADALLNEAKEV